MCQICNGNGATFKDHGFGVEITPCPMEACQKRNLKEAQAGRLIREQKRTAALLKISYRGEYHHVVKKSS